MRAQDVLHNLINHKGMYEITSYKLQENEADICIKALEEYIENHQDEIQADIEFQKASA